MYETTSLHIPPIRYYRALGCTMVNCNRCGKPLTHPIKKLENNMFCIEVYRCRKCHTTSKDAYYQIAAN